MTIKRTSMGALLTGLAALALTSCSDEWKEPWRDQDGESLSPRVIGSFTGPAHCGWESSVMLNIGWPLGTPQDARDRSQYVRDPKGIFETETSFLDNASLPADARDSGFRHDGAELWVPAIEAESAVYVVRGDDVERWPRTAKFYVCE